jgi:hypothetical protein
VPALPEHVIHVDVSEWLTSLTTSGTQPLSLVVRVKIERTPAFPADLARNPLPSRRSPFTSHRRILGEDRDGVIHRLLDPELGVSQIHLEVVGFDIFAEL